MLAEAYRSVDNKIQQVQVNAEMAYGLDRLAFGCVERLLPTKFTACLYCDSPPAIGLHRIEHAREHSALSLCKARAAARTQDSGQPAKLSSRQITSRMNTGDCIAAADFNGGEIPHMHTLMSVNILCRRTQ